MFKLFLVLTLFLNHLAIASSDCVSNINLEEANRYILDTLTSLEIRGDEVQSIKIGNTASQIIDSRRLVSINYFIQLENPSLLSRSIFIADGERKKMSIEISINESCSPNSISSSSIKLDGGMYNDVSEDDRLGLAEFNTKYVRQLLSKYLN
ncbi:MAG: hypothetical protein B7Y39_07640 [Bdellovibrio sp. 28-41-41]|nr:MAG: hypothetical protein B7Y39_07640 [Bdellovibrio sp. 28-41-41]